MIELQHVSKRYADAASPALRGVCLHLGEGELVVLLGQSGCGKTTTLKLINRLVEPSEGQVKVRGEDVALVDPISLRRSIGYVFQGVGLFPHLTVGENVAVMPRLLGWSEEARSARVDELLTLVGLSPAFRERPPRTLSGGQAQRVGVARALAARPSVMLMDEPFGAVDPLTRDTLQGEYRRIHQRLGLTTVLVTHDVNEALLMGDRLVVMHQGEVIADGAPRDLLASALHPEVARLFSTSRRQSAAVLAALGAGGAP